MSGGPGRHSLTHTHVQQIARHWADQGRAPCSLSPSLHQASMTVPHAGASTLTQTRGTRMCTYTPGVFIAQQGRQSHP